MKRKIRPIRVEGNIAFITLTKGYAAKIDAEDVPLVCDFNWRVSEHFRPDGMLKNAYAISMVSGKTTYMHRVIMAPGPLVVDHISGDGLDCRRSNMRVVEVAQNARNQKVRSDSTTGVKGVHLRKDTGKFSAHIMKDYIMYRLGCFDTIEEAKASYAEASMSMHGEFGRVE